MEDLDINSHVPQFGSETKHGKFCFLAFPFDLAPSGMKNASLLVQRITNMQGFDWQSRTAQNLSEQEPVPTGYCLWDSAGMFKLSVRSFFDKKQKAKGGIEGPCDITTGRRPIDTGLRREADETWMQHPIRTEDYPREAMLISKSRCGSDTLLV